MLVWSQLMNIFYLDKSPEKAAQAHFDKHVVKMILESAQLLSTAHRVLDGEEYIELNRTGARMKRWRHPAPAFDEALYKATHYNHPSAIWVRQSAANYKWLYQLFLELMKEYTYRYGKYHASERLIHYLELLPVNIPDSEFSEPTPAMDIQYIIPGDSVASYRNYYKQTKMHLKAYTRRSEPEWLTDTK
jgi:hypothetical protein